MLKIIQTRKYWLGLSSILVALSIVFLFLWKLDYGIDFTGGSLLELKFNTERPSVTEVQDAIKDIDLGNFTIQPVGTEGMIIRFQNTEEEKHKQVIEALNSINKAEDQTNEELDVQMDDNAEASTTAENINIEAGQVEELRFDSVGPSIGQELKEKSIYAIIAVLIFIVLYIAFVFRKVSKPVASWKYGVTAIIALFHDVLIVLGVFAVLGHFYNIEINTPFVAAILTVLGYSVNDTIVVFDRIRENIPRSDDDFETTVNNSVNQTLTRSLYTSLTTLLVLVSIIVFGGDSIRDFVLALSIGVFIGTYSSIFLASPVLVVWERLKNK